MKHIIIILFLLTPLSFYGKTEDKITIRGVIADVENNPAYGVTIHEKGNIQNKANIDINGEFSIEIDSKTSFVISYPTDHYQVYSSQEIDIKSRFINITLYSPKEFRSKYLSFDKIKTEQVYMEVDPMYEPPITSQNFMPRRSRDNASSIFLGDLRFDLDTKTIGLRKYIPFNQTSASVNYIPYTDVDYDKEKLVLADNLKLFVDKKFNTNLLSDLIQNKNNNITADTIDIIVCDLIEPITTGFYKMNNTIYYYSSEYGFLPANISWTQMPIRYIEDGIYTTRDHVMIISPKKKAEREPVSIMGDAFDIHYVLYKNDLNKKSLCDDFHKIDKDKLFIEVECID